MGKLYYNAMVKVKLTKTGAKRLNDRGRRINDIVEDDDFCKTDYKEGDFYENTLSKVNLELGPFTSLIEPPFEYIENNQV